MPLPTVKELWEDVKAFRRGERRVLAYGQRGRVYRRVRGDPGPPEVAAKSEVTITARVKRAGSDEWHEIDMATGREREE